MHGQVFGSLFRIPKPRELVPEGIHVDDETWAARHWIDAACSYANDLFVLTARSASRVYGVEDGLGREARTLQIMAAQPRFATVPRPRSAPRPQGERTIRQVGLYR